MDHRFDDIEVKENALNYWKIPFAASENPA